MHPEIDHFAGLGSWIHRWDPRWKLSGLALIGFGLAFERSGLRASPDLARDFPPALAGLALAVGLVRISAIPPGFALRRLRAPLFFLAMVMVILPLTHEGEGWSVGPLEVSRDGLLVATLIVIRALSLLLLVFPAFGTTRFSASMQALRSLRVPSALVQVTLLSYRYLFVWLDQYRRARGAMKTRGFRARTDAHTLRTLAGAVGMLLAGSLERTTRIHQAMRMRGYEGELPTVASFRTRPGDVAGFLLALLVSGGLVFWRLW